MNSPKPTGTDPYVCLECGLKQLPKQSRWGVCPDYSDQEIWLCGGCDVPWDMEVVLWEEDVDSYVDPNATLAAR